MKRGGFVYILTNNHRNVLYIGVTSNLQKRMGEHLYDAVPGFSKKYRLKTLVYYEQHETIEEAIAREKFIKGKTRKTKEALIDQLNPKWDDLTSHLS